MKSLNYFLFLSLLLLFSCGPKDSTPNTDVGVATAFINDLHQGKFKEADQLLLQEQDNQRLLKEYKSFFKSWPAEKLEYFKNNDVLIINEVSPVTDSITIVSYTTNYKKEERNKVKTVRVDGKWLVDFKYTFSGNL